MKRYYTSWTGISLHVLRHWHRMPRPNPILLSFTVKPPFCASEGEQAGRSHLYKYSQRNSVPLCQGPVLLWMMQMTRPQPHGIIPCLFSLAHVFTERQMGHWNKRCWLMESINPTEVCSFLAVKLLSVGPFIC